MNEDDIIMTTASPTGDPSFIVDSKASIKAEKALPDNKPDNRNKNPLEDMLDDLLSD